MSVRLRSHHLLCLLTYAGAGYTPAFTANFDHIVERIRQGEDIVFVGGPDDVCAPLLGSDDAHCRGQSVVERDEAAAGALITLLALPVLPGKCMTLNSLQLSRLRDAFAAGETRKACVGCEWASRCTSIAADGYHQTRFAPKR